MIVQQHLDLLGHHVTGPSVEGIVISIDFTVCGEVLAHVCVWDGGPDPYIKEVPTHKLTSLGKSIEPVSFLPVVRQHPKPQQLSLNLDNN